MKNLFGERYDDNMVKIEMNLREKSFSSHIVREIKDVIIRYNCANPAFDITILEEDSGIIVNEPVMDFRVVKYRVEEMLDTNERIVFCLKFSDIKYICKLESFEMDIYPTTLDKTLYKCKCSVEILYVEGHKIRWVPIKVIMVDY